LTPRALHRLQQGLLLQQAASWPLLLLLLCCCTHGPACQVEGLDAGSINRQGRSRGCGGATNAQLLQLQLLVGLHCCLL
jgi:hypothetical protein